MTYCIYRITSTAYQNIIQILASDNLDSLIENYNNGIMPTKGLNRKRFRGTCKLEIVEKFDNKDEMCRKYIEYTCPQIDRVQYAESLYERVFELDFAKKMGNIVDWLVSHYPKREFSFCLYSADDGYFGVYISKDNEVVERYLFHKTGRSPFERGFVEEE